MRRFVLAITVAVVAACSSGIPAVPPDGDASATPYRFGETFVIPTQVPTSNVTVVPADISTWLMVAPIGVGFGVAMPAQPAVSSTVLGDPPVPTTIWTYTDPNGRSFQVARSRLPARPTPIPTPTPNPTPTPSGSASASPTPTEDPLSKPAAWEGTVLQSLPGSSFARRDEMNVQGRPGLRYVIRAGNLRSEGLLVLDDELLYRVSMTYDVDRADEAALTAFLNSFTLMA